MDLVVEGIVKAFWLLVRADREVVRITLLTLRVSGLATLIAVVVGVPLGTVLALSTFRGRQVAVSLVNTGMGLPPVVVGLWVSILLWRYGPLGFLRLMYTPTAMVIAQSVIALPIVTGFTMAGIGQLDPGVRLQMLSLGASWWQLLWILLREARLSVLAAVIAGFGGVISEIGASMMVGGNVMGQTRILTT
ncbi:MAG: ABC transporter permease, partial [Bacillota bacterium]|nr:ABC transporter permease [Bacillota bacterium]